MVFTIRSLIRRHGTGSSFCLRSMLSARPAIARKSDALLADGLVVVDPEAELDFLHPLPVDLMWGVGPATKARLADIGVVTIGQLAEIPGWTLSNVLGSAAGEKLAALSWNRDPREIKAHRRAHSAGAQLALGRKPADEKVFKPALLQLADRVATRLRAKSRPGRTRPPRRKRGRPM